MYFSIKNTLVITGTKLLTFKIRRIFLKRKNIRVKYSSLNIATNRNVCDEFIIFLIKLVSKEFIFQ